MGPSPNQVLLFQALHNQLVVSSQLILISKDHLYAFLDGTLDEGLRLRANPCLSHGANLWGRAQGKQHMVLGGGYSGEDSLLRYKQRYAPNRSVLFSVGSKIFDHDAYQALIDKRAAWEREQGDQWSPAREFFPAYRG